MEKVLAPSLGGTNLGAICRGWSYGWLEADKDRGAS
jgi:hypothetical protein